MTEQAYFHIQSTTLSSSATSFTLNNIPQTYKHLIVDVTLQKDGPSSATNYFVFNSQTSVYNTTAMWLQDYIRNNEVSGNSSIGIAYYQDGNQITRLEISDYSKTDRHKNFITTMATPNATGPGAADGAISSGRFTSDAAITSITFEIGSGVMLAGSEIKLWGIK